MSPHIRLLRPAQWLKNSFVFTPLIFSKHLFDQDYLFNAALAFFAFSCASSLIYIVNDIVDRDADKLHPEKKKRPIASGEISISIAIIMAMFSGAAAFVISLFLPNEFAYAMLLYVVIQFAYSFHLKHIVILDLFIIATGFMLRVFSGALAIQVDISHWLVITTLFLSLFLAASKRRAELMMIKKQNFETKRRVLQEYSIPFLDSLLLITTTGMAISYSLYTMAERTIEVFRSEYLIFTTVFVLFGIFRYLFLVLVKEQGENPTAILTNDTPTAINLFFWLITCIMIIYFH
ncbi:MAG: decaprenyl-phosphate phosphoribosyltransferase [Bacteroidota bacterium]